MIPKGNMLSSISRQMKGIGFNLMKNQLAMCSTAAGTSDFETLLVSVPKQYVYHVQLNRPKQLNAMNKKMWFEIGKCFDTLASKDDCRSIVLSGVGKIFCAGIDLKDMGGIGAALAEKDDVARRCKILDEMIRNYQNYISALERCNKPVIAAVHNACVGGALDLISAADIRYCSEDAWFQIKEVDLGMAADVGTLQRFPKVIGNQSLVNELCLTARKFEAKEAKDCGFVGQVFKSHDSLMEGAFTIAEQIAAKSPVAVQGTKRNLVFSREHTTQEGLDHIRAWNMTMLQSEDFMNAAMALATKSDPPIFAKL
ncbi:hypothetical protein B566_EDAN000902 [Ephemera danica]|nr:hypothetical protein B566_EDAN000902 [Ephemera danica]